MELGGAFLLKPINVGGHAAYQDRVLSQLRKYYPDAASSLPAHTWDIIEKFWNLDLSEVDTLMQDRYSAFGPEPRLPSDLLRSLLVSVEFQVVSYTKWAAELKVNHLYAILSGFLVGDTPGVGTFADFFSRLWLSDKNNLSDPAHPPKEKPQKPKEKGEKAPPVGKVTVEDLFAQFEENPPQDMNPCKRIFEIFRVLFLDRSIQEGLLDLKNLSLSGDGTPAYTAARERKNAPVTAWRTESVTVNAAGFTASRTVISAGIPIGTAITLAMISIPSQLLTQKTTSRYSHSWVRLPGMIPTAFYMRGTP